MEKIDIKDRKILYQLDLNCRQSNTQIGKKVGLSKQVVDYRIKRLEEKGIIESYRASIDTFRLGYNVSRIYLSLQYINPDLKNEIIQHFINYKNVWGVITVKGPFDLDLIFWVKEMYEFYDFWEKTLEKYGNYFEDKILSALIQVSGYRLSYLLLDEYKKSDRDRIEMFGGGKTVKIDELDYQILNELANNARVPIIELSEKFGCSSQTIQYRIKNLMEKDVIQGFRVEINTSKFGLEQFLLGIYLKQHSKKNQIMEYKKNNPHLAYIQKSTGYADIEFEIHIENSNKLIRLVEDINAVFPNAIRKFDYFTTKKVHKSRFFPEMEF